jgi:hypothetical protein
LGGWAVAMFFVLSGYWIARMWDEKYSREDTHYLTFVISLCWRLKCYEKIKQSWLSASRTDKVLRSEYADDF